MNKRTRDSNLELMRIVMMLLIVAHHYVVNSGVLSLWTPATITPNGIFLTFWGMWGKAAINSFVMVTGWFMCCSNITWKKYVRLLAQIYFWKVLIWVFLALVGAEGITAKSIIASLLATFRNIDGSFMPSFLVMYLMIPFLNRLIGTLDKSLHIHLLALLIGVYTFTTTFLASSTAFSEVGWYCTLYLLSAYLRIYEPTWTKQHYKVSLLFALTVILCIASAAVFLFADHLMGSSSSHAYWFVSDSGKALALLFGVTCFLWFKNLHLRSNNIINAVASTTFGVLLIHAHSDCMRNWLWGTIVNVPHLYHLETAALLGISIIVVLAVFAICSALDYLRIQFVEPHFMNWLNGKGSILVERLIQSLQRLEA